MVGKCLGVKGPGTAGNGGERRGTAGNGGDGGSVRHDGGDTDDT